MFKFLYNIFKGWSDDQELKQQAIQNKSKFYPSSTSSTGMRDTRTGEPVIHADSFTGDVWTKSNYKEMAKKKIAEDAAYFAKSRAEREAKENRKISLIKDLERCLGHTVVEPFIWQMGDDILGGCISVRERRNGGTMSVNYTETPNRDGWYTGYKFDGTYKEYLRK